MPEEKRRVITFSCILNAFSLASICNSIILLIVRVLIASLQPMRVREMLQQSPTKAVHPIRNVRVRGGARPSGWSRNSGMA